MVLLVTVMVQNYYIVYSFIDIFHHTISRSSFIVIFHHTISRISFIDISSYNF